MADKNVCPTLLIPHSRGRAGVGYLVLAEQPQIVECNGKYFATVEVALEDLGAAALVLLEGFLFFLLRVELGTAGEELFLVQRHFLLGLLLFVLLDVLLQLREISRVFGSLRRQCLERADGAW